MPRRRTTALLSLAAMMSIALALGGAGERDASRKSARHNLFAQGRAIAQPPQPPQQQPAPDQVGGIVSTYICIRAQPGVAALRLADGSWTFRRAAAANPDNVGGAAIDEAALHKDERDLRTTLARHRVMRIDRFFGGVFKRPDLAAKHGLDRAYIAHVAPRADVVALNTEVKGGAFAALIERSELDNVGSLAGIPNDTHFGNQWGMHNTGQTIGVPGVPDADIDAPEAWDIHTGSASTIIAIIDSGVQADHPDLIGRVLAGVDAYGPTQGPPPLSWGPDTTDLHSSGHGTHVSGIAAARGNDGSGVAGVNWNAKILPVRVVNPTTMGVNQTDVSEAVIWAADNGADVINMSIAFMPMPFGSSSPNATLESALAYAYDGGALPVAASGNNNTGTVAWPAKYAKCMAVGATTNTDVRAGFSNFGAEMDVVAPGDSVYSCSNASNWVYNSGTSMATPHVSGVASMIRSRNPALTIPQIEAIIKNTAQDKGAAGWDTLYGWGRINLHAALLAAAPPCPGNANVDTTVNINDLLAVIIAWGACPIPPALCPADVAPPGPPPGDGVVNINDLLSVIIHWGPCP